MSRVAGLLLALILGSAVAAETPEPQPGLPLPTGPVVLTITGAVPITNVEGAAVFDLAMLRALPEAVVATTTPWTQGRQEFRGARLQDTLRMVGVEAGTVVAHAINDFIATIPLDDPRNEHAVIAFEIDGAEIPIRGKGPLWLIYPFEHDLSLRTEVMYARSIWQLDRFEVSAREQEVTR